jgi:hypothetical protein
MGTNSSVCIRPELDAAGNWLGVLGELRGTWVGHGFNLIARPDSTGGGPLYLQLNQTLETLRIDAIQSPTPSCGLAYLLTASDAATGSLLHLEPGVWLTRPSPGAAPGERRAAAQRVARLTKAGPPAQGTIKSFTGPPVLASGETQCSFSAFPSFNSTPFAARPGKPATLNAAGSSERLTAPALAPPAAPFPEYDLAVPVDATNPRTPFGTTDPVLPAAINGVPMQAVINDPVKILQSTVQRQVDEGYTFAGAALNVATQSRICFLDRPNEPAGPLSVITVADAAGGTQEVLSPQGGEPPGASGPNAEASLVYATFWIEQVTRPGRGRFMQLQYAQVAVHEFPPHDAPAAPVLSWPQISVATLRKSFT